MNRRNLMTAMLASAAAGLAGCAGLGAPTVITLSETELLLPAQNRLSMTLNLSSRERLSGKVGSGHLGFDSMLRYDARDASVRLTQVRIDRLSFEAGAAAASKPSAEPGNVARIGQALAERALEDLVIYRVPAERQATLRQFGLQPGAVTVTAGGLEITLARAGY